MAKREIFFKGVWYTEEELAKANRVKRAMKVKLCKNCNDAILSPNSRTTVCGKTNRTVSWMGECIL